MEQKKLLLVAISVGVFFVIVIGTALVFLKPAADMNSAGTAYVSGNSYIGAGYSSGLYQTPGEDLYQYEAEPFQDAVFESEDGDFSASGDFYDESSAFDYYADGFPRTLITVDPKPAPGVPDAPASQRTVAAAPPPAVETKTNETKPAPAPVASTTSAPSAAPAASTVQTSAAPRAAAPAPVPARTRDDYWVQTGAFTLLSRAEVVKQTLADKGITSIIENRSIGDTLYFRVRIGPYTSQNEADYWLNLIQSISGFEDSQVRKTQTVL